MNVADNDISLTEAQSHGAKLNINANPSKGTLQNDYIKDIVPVWESLSEPALHGNFIDNGLLSRTPANIQKNVNPSLALRLTPSVVGETFFKAVMPCEVSPLGFHLANSIKEKIGGGNFIVMLSLLPVSKEFLAKSEKKARTVQRRIGGGLFPKLFRIGCRLFAFMQRCWESFALRDAQAYSSTWIQLLKPFVILVVLHGSHMTKILGKACQSTPLYVWGQRT